MPYNEQEQRQREIDSQPEKEKKLSPEKVKTSATGLIKLFDEKIKKSAMMPGKGILKFMASSPDYYEPNYIDKLTGGRYEVLRLENSVDVSRVTKGLGENNMLYHKERVHISLGNEPACIYEKYNLNSDDLNGRKPDIIIEHHYNTPSAIKKAKDVIEAMPQKKPVQKTFLAGKFWESDIKFIFIDIFKLQHRQYRWISENSMKYIFILKIY